MSPAPLPLTSQQNHALLLLDHCLLDPWASGSSHLLSLRTVVFIFEFLVAVDTDTGEQSGRLLGGVTSITQRSTKSRRRSVAATTVKATPTWRSITCIHRD
jgi:hypothetical protein